MKAAAIIVAAGKGQRFGGRTPKQFLLFKGKPLFLWSIIAFRKLREIRQVILVVPGAMMPSLHTYGKRYGFTIVAGGKERQDSVMSGLAAVSRDTDYVAIHDAARPLVSPSLIRRTLRAARQHGAAIAAVPARDTIKLSNDGTRINSTIPRKSIWLAQTPQTFSRPLIVKSYELLASLNVTDDAQAAELAGYPVAIVESDYSNIKITEPEDLKIAGLLVAE
ncbi:MAG: 2-C-methyl-D-erythritol 4-phosphate cytidylyltransferase [Elusimicrobia bacterium RIFOXYA2_FULL_50_26]|nr:MAG: 2-C-methyl-D-erythritol 4-phosphate cytidylyltransferase [Elusimicrobia bacterium RIFOXYA2_FULL_50_26]OGS23703.1 MAG: 2-C-methyl-D-erythritol 4-phosphate cytidylyltransferase [Elusimicrobia bacterium RIFOXYB2_FULL_50_12]